jgi:soluble P-type ATPase
VLAIEIPGRPALALEHLFVDLNGTLTSRGVLMDGVAARLQALSATVSVTILSADTFGRLGLVAPTLGAGSRTVSTGAEKKQLVETLGAGRCVAIGNGANDRAMIEAAGLGIVVIGPEGAAGETVRAADVVCTSIQDALDLLLEPRALVATLRA